MAEEYGTTKPNRTAKQQPKAHRNVVSRPLGISKYLRNPTPKTLKEKARRQAAIEDRVRKSRREAREGKYTTRVCSNCYHTGHPAPVNGDTDQSGQNCTKCPTCTRVHPEAHADHCQGCWGHVHAPNGSWKHEQTGTDPVTYNHAASPHRIHEIKRGTCEGCTESLDARVTAALLREQHHVPDHLPADIRSMKSMNDAVIIRQGTKARCMECDGIYDVPKFEDHKCNYMDAEGVKRNRYDQPMAKARPQQLPPEKVARCAYEGCGHRESQHAWLAFANPGDPRHACLECDHKGEGRGVHTFISHEADVIPDALPEEIAMMDIQKSGCGTRHCQWPGHGNCYFCGNKVPFGTLTCGPCQATGHSAGNIKKSGYERCQECSHILGNHGMAGGCGECVQAGRMDRHTFVHSPVAKDENASTRIWQPPTASRGSNAHRRQKNDIMWALHDKYHGTSQDKTEKSQAIYKSASKCPRCAVGGHDRSRREDGLRHTATMKPPSVGTMMRWEEKGSWRATDGCGGVEADGHCPHGHQSWGLRMGIV